MNTILKYAAGVTTFLSLSAFFGGLYVWLQSRRREQSVVDIVKGQGIVQAEHVVGILGQFESDEARLNALQHVLGYSKDRAADVLSKVKPNVDVDKLFRTNEVQLQHRFLIGGLVLIILAALALLASRSGAQAGTDSRTPTGTKMDTGPRMPSGSGPDAEATDKSVLLTWVPDGDSVLVDDKKLQISAYVNQAGPHDAHVAYTERTRQSTGTFKVVSGQRLTVPTTWGRYYIDVRQIGDKQVLIEVTRHLISERTQK